MKLFWDFSSDLNFLFFLAFLFLLPFSIAGTYLFFILLMISAIVSLFRQKLAFTLPRFFWFFLVFAFFTLVSTLFSVDRWTSLKDNRELFTLLTIPFSILLVDSARRLRLALVAILLSQSLSAVVGIVQAVVHGVNLTWRIRGFTSHWMTYAGLLMLAFVFGSVVWLQAEKNREGLSLLFALPVLLVAIGFSLTRSTWVGIAAALFFFLVYFKPRWFIWIVPLTIAVFLIMPRPVQHRFLSIVNLSDATTSDRFYMADAGWRMFRDYPFFGVGAHNVEKMYPAYRPAGAKQDNPHLHNNYLQVLAERGGFALAAFIAAWIFFFIDGMGRSRRQYGKRKAISVAALFTTIAFLVAGFFEYNFGDAEVRFLILFFLAVPFIKINEGENDHLETNRGNPFAV